MTTPDWADDVVASPSAPPLTNWNPAHELFLSHHGPHHLGLRRGYRGEDDGGSPVVMKFWLWFWKRRCQHDWSTDVERKVFENGRVDILWIFRCRKCGEEMRHQ